MKKIALIALCAVAFITTAFVYQNKAANNPKGYTIKGEVTGYADSTLLYLVNRSEGTPLVIDSTIILNGQFKFKGIIPGNELDVSIETKNLGEYKLFWLENNILTFKAQKGKFRDAVITGSNAQNDDDKLTVLTNPIERQLDSLGGIHKKDLSEQAKAWINKQVDSLRHGEVLIYIDFIAKNPSSIVSADILDIFAIAIGVEKSRALYNSFSEENKETQYGRDVSKFISLNKQLKEGDHYADFSEKTPQGRDVKISDFAGKVILVDFWASWCVPCRRGNPELVKTYALYKDKGFEIVSVSFDTAPTKQDWVDAIKKDGLTWPNISELKGDKCDAALMYGVNAIPDSFLIDKNGVIVARDLEGQALRDKIKELLK